MESTTKQVIRDLKWVVNSPSLIRPPLHEVATFDASAVSLDALGQLLGERKNFRVGRYFESLVNLWIESIQGCEIVEYQKQLFEGNRTIGEIDFLYRNFAGELTHLETAVKFYLHYSGEHRDGSHFIGPNSSDNFEQKCHRLFGQQMKLGQRYYPEVSRVEAFVKGRIFYHPESLPPTILPEQLSTSHLRGNWIHANELHWLDGFHAESFFFIQQKPHWLADAIADLSEPNLKSRQEIQAICRDHFQDSIRPFLISAMELQNDLYVEYNRFFVVSENWPNCR